MLLAVGSGAIESHGKVQLLYHSKNSYGCQLQLVLETSGSFPAATWVESFIRQNLGFHLSSVMQCSTERYAQFWGGKSSETLSGKSEIIVNVSITVFWYMF